MNGLPALLLVMTAAAALISTVVPQAVAAVLLFAALTFGAWLVQEHIDPKETEKR